MTQAKPQNVQKAPIEFSTRILYNPQLETSYNLVPGVLCMLMCVITIMMTSMSIAKEKEIGTFETLISAPVTVPQILLGKTIPYLIIGCVNLPLVFFVAVAGFDVPMRGSYIWLALSTMFFLITTVSIGTMLSIVARNQQQAMMGSFIFLMPSIMLSGVMFPIDNMPWILKVVAAFNPLMYFATLLRNIMLKGGDYHVLVTHTLALFLIAVVCVTTAFKKFKLHLG
jgi:ABC-2 type transport system permease protein